MLLFMLKPLEYIDLIMVNTTVRVICYEVPKHHQNCCPDTHNQHAPRCQGYSEEVDTARKPGSPAWFVGCKAYMP